MEQRAVCQVREVAVLGLPASAEVNWFAFFGGFFVVALGIAAYYVTGQWQVLELGSLGLLVILVLIAPRGRRR